MIRGSTWCDGKTTRLLGDNLRGHRQRSEIQEALINAYQQLVGLAVLNSPEFVDLAPQQIYAKLLDQGIYLGSVSTFYRVLEENQQVKERRVMAKHPPRAIPELVATAPGQVLSWDITKLAGPVKGTYFDCYLMIDIYSWFIVGAHVHATESAVLAVEMMKEIFGIHGVPQVVHADRGTSMTSKTVAALLSDLEVTRSHSRPRVSNDNPYSESLFKTMKYGPTFPERFASLGDARAFISEFVDWYNHHHQHSGIGFHTPANLHYGFADSVARKRSQTLAAARARHPIDSAPSPIRRSWIYPGHHGSTTLRNPPKKPQSNDYLTHRGTA